MKEKQVFIITQQYTYLYIISTQKHLVGQMADVDDGICIVMPSLLKNVFLVSIVNEQ